MEKRMSTSKEGTCEDDAKFLSNGNNQHPKRVLGIPAASSLVAGGMIGSGIFFLPQLVMMYSGSVGMFLSTWLLCGLVAFIGGLCWVELGLTFPKSGGEYILMKETLGPVPAFVTLWLRLLIVMPTVSVTKQLVFAIYLMEPFFPGCADREDLVPLLKFIATSSLCSITLLNCLSVTWAARTQVLFTAGKLLTLLIVVGMGIFSLSQGITTSFKNAFDGTTTEPGVLTLGFQSCFWAYEGWDLLNDVTEEVKKPSRNMPWAVLGSISLVTCCYLVVNVAYLAILTPQELKGSRATAAIVVEKTFGPSVGWIVPVLVSVSLFGSALGSTFGAGRVMFSAAREGHLPRFLGMIHTNKKTPIPALLFMNLMGCMVMIPKQSSVQNLIRLLSTAAWLNNTITTIGLLWTRYKRPDLDRPIKLPIFIPVMFLFIALYLTITPFIKAPIESSISLSPILAGLPLYYFIFHLKATPKTVLRIFDWISFKTQQILNVRFPSTIAEKD